MSDKDIGHAKPILGWNYDDGEDKPTPVTEIEYISYDQMDAAVMGVSIDELKRPTTNLSVKSEEVEELFNKLLNHNESFKALCEKINDLERGKLKEGNDG